MPRSQFPAIRLSLRDILFENNHFLAINKRQGWLVHPSLDKKRPSVLTSLKQFLRNRDNKENVHLSLPHRLDVETSGVLLFTKSQAADKHMSTLLQNHDITKKYIAVCEGDVTPRTGRIENFLKVVRTKSKDKTIVVRSGGKKAITEYETLDNAFKKTLLGLTILTGRKHQIRAHCSDLGFPLVGDCHYGAQSTGKPFALHATLLEFKGLDGDSLISIESKLPEQVWPPCQEEATSTHLKQTNEKVVVFYKPYGVLCQFTKIHEETKTLGDFMLPKNVYPIGRLDKDSEGLVVLTSDKSLQNKIAHPKEAKEKIYWVQVEGQPEESDLMKIRKGIHIKSGKCLPCKIEKMNAPDVPERVPAVRKRKTVPDSWLEIRLTEGKNRQIRKMTAAIGFPTLRLLRVGVAKWSLGNLKPGEFHEI